MNKKEYMIRLKTGLNRLPKAEADSVIEYYTEYFDDAGEENEQAVIEELGEPREVAGRVIAELAIKYMNEPDKSVKGSLNSVKITILALLAAPVALPLAFAAVTTILCLLFAALLLYASMWLVVAAVGVYGIIGLGVSVYYIFASFSSGIAILGSSLAACGGAVLLAVGGIKFGKWSVQKIPLLFQQILKGRRAK